jgi:hypothetical protein
VDKKVIKKKLNKPDKQELNRDKKGKFIKGVSGNPGGRPKVSYIDQLCTAIKTVEADKKKELFIRFVEQAYANPSIMIALMNKLLANKMHTEIEGLEPIEIIIKRVNAKSS